MDLYSIGEMLIDFTPGNETGVYIRNAGGAPANVAIAMANNGLSAGMNCCVGDDDFGHFLMDTLKQYHVRAINTELCTTAFTTLSFVTIFPDGDRSFAFARKPGADTFLSEDKVKKEDIANSVIVHAGSCSLSASPADKATIKALRIGNELGKLVSFDVNYRNVMWNNDENACLDKVKECLPYVNLLKISEEEIGMFGKSNVMETLTDQYHIALIVETLGAHGARAYFNHQYIEVPGRKANCIDATAAGDAFWGGLLSSLRLQNVSSVSDLTAEKIKTAMNYGNTAGWLCVQKKGAIASLPSRKEIEQNL